MAAERGHRVSLFERNAQLGGALVWASILHPENEPFLRYLRNEIARSTVTVELSHTVDVDEIAALDPEAVIVATGASVVVPPHRRGPPPHVHSGPALRELLVGHAEPGQPGWQRLGAAVLSGWRQRLVQPAAVRLASRAWLPLGRRVVIVGGDLVAIELAEFLSTRGRFVTILESGRSIAPEVGLKRRTEHMDRLDRLAVPCMSAPRCTGSPTTG